MPGGVGGARASLASTRFDAAAGGAAGTSRHCRAVPIASRRPYTLARRRSSPAPAARSSFVYAASVAEFRLETLASDDTRLSVPLAAGRLLRLCHAKPEDRRTEAADAESLPHRRPHWGTARGVC